MIAKNLLTPNPTSSDIIQLTIDRLSYNGGRGVGRHEGVVVFVPETAPGDIVRARVTLKKSNLWEAELVEILTPSAHRRSPPCPVAGSCGGCSWQHVNYDEQLRQKQSILEFSLKGFSGVEIQPIRPAPEEWRYRNRIQLHLQGSSLGFFAKGSQTIVPIEDCLIADARLVSAFEGLREAAPKTMKRVEIALTTGGQTTVDWEERSGETALFSQVNIAQNAALIEQVLAVLPESIKTVADLYAGYGNISLPIARKFPQAEVFAVELSRESVRRGEHEAKALLNVNFSAEDVEKFLKRERRRRFEAIVLDPPRAGCSNSVVAALAAMKSPLLIYVSCNPMTFVRDAKKLIETGGYRLESVRPLDMFPQTEHIELVAVLRQ